jgi:hypothetical protein
VGYHSPPIIKHLEPLIGDLFRAGMLIVYSMRDNFLALWGDYNYHSECQEINWDDKSRISSDLHTQATGLHA